jgi:hypothetical protein
VSYRWMMQRKIKSYRCIMQWVVNPTAA